MVATRLCIVTPKIIPPDFESLLDSALSAGDVASLLIDIGDEERLGKIAAIAMRHGVAAIATGSPGRAKVDGLHVESGPTGIAAARRTVGEGGIVGAGGVASRHDAMLLGEALPDYVFFGRRDGDDIPPIHPKALELAAWWAELFEIPAIVMGGSALASAAEARAAKIEFVALRSAIWDHAGGPAAAVAAANEILDPEAKT